MFQINRICTYKVNAKMESYWSWLNRLSYGSGKEGLCRIPKAVGRKRGKTDVSRALEEHKASSTGEAHLRDARGLEVEKCSCRLWQDCWWLLWLVLLACTGVVVLQVCLEWLDEEQKVWKYGVGKKDSRPLGKLICYGWEVWLTLAVGRSAVREDGESSTGSVRLKPANMYAIWYTMCGRSERRV